MHKEVPMKYSLLILLFIFSCSTPYQADKTYKLTLLHTNDHHGRFWANQNGEWGLAARYTLVQDIRQMAKKDNSEILLLDAGDVNTGIPQSDMLHAEPDFKGMNRLNYDAMAVGNHEFDNDIKTIRKQESWSNFPFLSANIYYKNKRMFKPYIIKNLSGFKVAIIGLTTIDTPFTSKLGMNSDILFTDPIEEAKKIVPELKTKAHLIIALTHMGHYEDEQNGSNSPGDVTLARQVDGIDLIIGGHSQKPLFKPDIQNNTIIVQAHEWGKYVGRVDLLIKNKKITLKKYELIAVNHKDSANKIAEDQGMLKFLAPFKAKGDKTLLVKVGSTEEKLIGDRDIVRKQQTNLGHLIAEAYRLKFNADIGLTNSGGIRDSISKGDINYEHVLTVLPFGNDIVTTKMSGKELKNYLQKILSELLPESGSYPQFAGIELAFNKKTQVFSKLVIANKPIDLNKKYTVALPSFIASGGDKWPDLRPIGLKAYGFTDAAVLREFLTSKSVITKNQFKPSQIKVQY